VTVSHDEIPVLIIGGSLVGLTTALLLGDLGLPSLSVDRHAGTAIHARAGHFQLGTMEMLRQIGLDDTVRAKSLETYHPTGGIIAMESLAGRELATYVKELNEGVEGLSPTRASSSTRTCSSRSCVHARSSSAPRCATGSRRSGWSRTTTA
jgi:hypothetical protein